MLGNWNPTAQYPAVPTFSDNASKGFVTQCFQQSANRPANPAPLQLQEETPRPNRTGLPDRLKMGVERLSGYSMDDVRVHRNSSKPAQLHALAYAQGTDIHLGPGQERHLPHEAWHVVQQKQGRVQATRQLKGVGVNADAGLEREADVIGNKCKLHCSKGTGQGYNKHQSPDHERTNGSHTFLTQSQAVAQCEPLRRGAFNVVGEYHPESNPRRIEEQQYLTQEYGLTHYWREGELRQPDSMGMGQGPAADPHRQQVHHPRREGQK